MHQKLELCISSGVCGVVQSRMGILTGLYHVPQVFHVASSQLSYSHMLDENNGSHLMVVKHQLKLNFIYVFMFFSNFFSESITKCCIQT